MLQEKDILQDLLVLDKDMMKTYTSVLVESSCPKERSLLEKHFKALGQEQYAIFDAMSQKGYYPIKNADAAEVKAAKKQMEQTSQTLKKSGCSSGSSSSQSSQSSSKKSSSKPS